MDSLFFPQHLISMDSLNAAMINSILDKAQHYQHALDQQQPVSETLAQTLIAHLFFEPSTRTCSSFEIAAMRLQAKTLTPLLTHSSLEKGETIEDTVNNLAAMGIRTFVIRHKQNHFMTELAKQLKYPCRLICAGEGTLHHPSQALLDLYTIRQHKPDWHDLSVAIVGDLHHSRVARSLIRGLQHMGTRDIRLVCPEYLTIQEYAGNGLRAVDSLKIGLEGVDVVVCLRLQKERLQKEHLLDERGFFSAFMVDQKALAFAKPDAIVMHPGPINRDCEISSAVADGPQSVILRQVENSIPVRMAILKCFS